MRRFLLTVATAATALAGAACSDVTGIGRDLEGTYTLQTVNGASPPEYVAFFDAEVIDGEVTFYDDGTFYDVLWIRFDGDFEDTPIITEGSYTRSGSRIFLDPEDPRFSEYEMTWDGNRLIQEESGLRLVYRR